MMATVDSTGAVGDGRLATICTTYGLIAKMNQDDEFWVADSGATEHMT